MGTLISAGIPNIIGTLTINGGVPDTQSGFVTGVFSGDLSDYKDSGGYGKQVSKITFDASLCSTVYGNSTTVTPNSVAVGFYIKFA